jgi:ribosomal protein S18 acetylase RimI-like enzyme
MEYSFDMCFKYGKIFLSNDQKGCALIILPDKGRSLFHSVFLDIKLILTAIGLSGIRRAAIRESKIKKQHPTKCFYYLWFIGVDPASQGRGIGSELLKIIINEALALGRPIYLETSTVNNLPWYEKFGFKVYNKLDLGYDLYCMKKE